MDKAPAGLLNGYFQGKRYLEDNPFANPFRGYIWNLYLDFYAVKGGYEEVLIRFERSDDLKDMKGKVILDFAPCFNGFEPKTKEMKFVIHKELREDKDNLEAAIKGLVNKIGASRFKSDKINWAEIRGSFIN